MSGRGIKGLKARVGRECCISKGGARLNRGGIQAGGVRGRVMRLLTSFGLAFLRVSVTHSTPLT